MEPKYKTIDPATGERLETYPSFGDDEVQQAIFRSAEAFEHWRQVDLDRRAAALRRAADLMESGADDLARLMATEMGKPVAEGQAEVNKCAWACRYYSGEASVFLADSPRESDGSEAFVRYEPLGPVLAIMPWNFPFWQFFRFAAPALMAGNVTLLKHAPNTPGCAARIESLLREAGLDEGVVQNLYVTDDQAADVIADERVRGVTLTGSTRAGRAVASTAGGHLKTMVMELGGSDPFIVLDDADVDRAVDMGVKSRCLNNGQSCIAAKRFIVEAGVYERFREEFVEKMSGLRMGDPLGANTDLGPLARQDLRDGLAEQVAKSVAAGARALCGGERPSGKGFFYPATVLEDAPDDSPAACEEMFGPVATLFRVEGEDEAIRRANATEYGLGASLWTKDRARAARLIPRLESGSVFVNGMVKSDPRLPFGGVKQSGFGRELAREGMLEFVNAKTVWVA